MKAEIQGYTMVAKGHDPASRLTILRQISHSLLLSLIVIGWTTPCIGSSAAEISQTFSFSPLIWRWVGDGRVDKAPQTKSCLVTRQHLATYHTYMERKTRNAPTICQGLFVSRCPVRLLLILIYPVTHQRSQGMRHCPASFTSDAEKYPSIRHEEAGYGMLCYLDGELKDHHPLRSNTAITGKAALKKCPTREDLKGTIKEHYKLCGSVASAPRL